MVKLKANVKNVVEIIGQSDIRILTLHPKVVWKTCVMKKSFEKRVLFYLINLLSDV